MNLDRRRFLGAAGLAAGAAALGDRQDASRGIAASHPRVRLAHLPTAVEELPRLSKRLGGPRLLVKRDDQTGLAFGGNKTRKLEFLVADALQQGADTVITSGSIQSNHCRQTAAAAARVGLRCVLALGGEEPEGPAEGNLLLDRLLGAEVRIGATAEQAAAAVEARGGKPYVVPGGGSNAVGAAGYAAAVEELMAQLAERGDEVDWMITATGSGGTQAGLCVGARATGYSGKVLGIAVSRPADQARRRIAPVANATAAHLGVDATFAPEDLLVNGDFLGGGYAVMGDLERGAIRTAAATEGLLLDPVYTGRAFGGMLRLIEAGFFRKQDTVLFWHTGGTPALFTSKYGPRLA